MFYQLYTVYSLFVCLVCTRRQHIEGDSGITRKYRKPEAPQSTRKVFVATQRQCWWDAKPETIHQNVLLLFSVTQEHDIIDEKWRFIKTSDLWRDRIKKLDEDTPRSKNRYKLFLSKASKVMANPAWVNVYIPGYVMPDIQCMIRSISVNNSSKCSNCYWPYAFGVLAVLCVKFVLCYMLGWILEIRCPRQTRRKQPYVLHLLYNNFICWKLHFSFCLAIRLCVKVHFTL